MINVTVAVLGGGDTKQVELAEGKRAGHAVVKAGFELDKISKIKRNGVVITRDTVLDNGDVLLVVREKMAGALNEDLINAKEEEKKLIQVSGEVQVEKKEKVINFDTGATIFDFIRVFITKNGLNLNNLIKVTDTNGQELKYDEKLVDKGHYVVVMSETSIVEVDTVVNGKSYRDEDYDNEDYSDY